MTETNETSTYESASAHILRAGLRGQRVVWTPETGWTDGGDEAARTAAQVATALDKLDRHHVERPVAVWCVWQCDACSEEHWTEEPSDLVGSDERIVVRWGTCQWTDSGQHEASSDPWDR